MITVIITTEAVEGNVIIINEKNDINHLKNAFRVKIGEEIRAVDGENEYFCKILEVEKHQIILEITEIKNIEQTKVNIVAGISILKNDKMELTIQKLTEIGIDKIIPVETKRTIVKLKEKKDKWDVVSKEATKQCQRTKFLEIDNIKKLSNIKYEEYDLIFVPYECEEDSTLKKYLREISESPKNVLYLIGPEGGFDISEIEYLKNISKAKIVTLGKNILRAETAAIVVGGILINEFK